MARGINKALIIDLYESGMSIPEVAEKVGASRSTVRYHLKRADALRSRTDGVRLAAEKDRIGSRLRGQSRTFSDNHKRSISQARRSWAESNAKGTRITSSGYVEFTRGAHKGRSVHVVKMQARLGRPLRKDECVHHIDGDRQNNDDNNLALLTRSGHTRLHRREDELQGIERRRNADGTWR